MRVLGKTAFIMNMAVITALSACTSMPDYNHLDPRARPLIQEVDSVLISKQDVVGADIKVSKISSYVQGNIIPVLIDIGLNTYRTSKSNKLIAPIRDNLGDYNFTQDIKDEFNRALLESNLQGIDELKILRQEPRGFRAAFIRNSEADAVMFIDVKHAFTPSFDALELTSTVMMFPVNPALSPYKEKPNEDMFIELGDNIYRNQFKASIPVGIEDAGTTENGAAWAEKTEEELVALIQKASQKLADHIAYDLSLDEVDEEVAKTAGNENSREANESVPVSAE